MKIQKIYPSRYDYGVKIMRHKGVDITTSVNSEIETTLLNKIPNEIDYRTGHCPAFAVHRPDTISHIFYNSPSRWWFIQLFNNINDPFEALNGGDRVLIPNDDILRT